MLLIYIFILSQCPGYEKGASFSTVAVSQLPAGIVIFKNKMKNNRKYMRCDYCQKYPNTVKQFHPRGNVPMATNEARYRSKTLQEHIQSSYHKECERIFRLPTIPSEVQRLH